MDQPPQLSVVGTVLNRHWSTAAAAPKQRGHRTVSDTPPWYVGRQPQDPHSTTWSTNRAVQHHVSSDNSMVHWLSRCYANQWLKLWDSILWLDQSIIVCEWFNDSSFSSNKANDSLWFSMIYSWWRRRLDSGEEWFCHIGKWMSAPWWLVMAMWTECLTLHNGE